MATIRARLAPALALLTLASGCQTLGSIGGVLSQAERPSVSFTGLRLGSIGLDSAELLVDLDVANPYDVDLPLVELSYGLSSGELPFASGTAALDGAVPARGSRVVSLPLVLRYKEVLAVLSHVTPGEVVPYTAALAMRVDAPVVGRLELPVARDGELPIPAAPRVSLASVAWSEASLSEVGATLSIAVENPNSFPVELAGMSYALELDQLSVAQGRLAEGMAFEAGGAGVLKIPISVSPLKLGAAAWSLIRGKQAQYALAGALDLTTPFGPMALPFAREGTAPLR